MSEKNEEEKDKMNQLKKNKQTNKISLLLLNLNEQYILKNKSHAIQIRLHTGLGEKETEDLISSDKCRLR